MGRCKFEKILIVPYPQYASIFATFRIMFVLVMVCFAYFLDDRKPCNLWSLAGEPGVDTITITDGAFLPIENVYLFQLEGNLEDVKVDLSLITCKAGGELLLC